jgi:hypothetical protein
MGQGPRELFKSCLAREMQSFKKGPTGKEKARRPRWVWDREKNATESDC